jgi:hypothetical protein
MRTLLALIVLSAVAAACHERKAATAPRPDYDGSRAASEKAHKSLDNEAGGN